MYSTIRFWTNSHSPNALLHDRNFAYYYSDILNKVDKFVESVDIADIQIIPKFNNNQVEMSFIISPTQLLRLENINFDIKDNVLFCFLPLINFSQYIRSDSPSIKLEFWRVVDWEYIYFPPKDKKLVSAQKGSITIYARKDIIYTYNKELGPAELFINRSTDFLPATENLQLCSPICAYGADIKTQISKEVVKTYDKENKDYETVFILNTADITTATEYFTNFSSFWANWVRDILKYLPTEKYGDYYTLSELYSSFRAYNIFGDSKYYFASSGLVRQWRYPIFGSGAKYFPYGSIGGGEMSYYVPYNDTHYYVNILIGAAQWGREFISLHPFDYKFSRVVGSFKTTKIRRGSNTSDSNKIFFTYQRGNDYNEIVRAFQGGLGRYVNLSTFYDNQFIKTAKAVASAMGLGDKLQITQIEKAESKSTSGSINIDIGICVSGKQGYSPYVKKGDRKQFLVIKTYSEIIYPGGREKSRVIFGSETPFKDHWDAAHIHKALIGNRISVFPLDRRYDYKESISGEGSNTVMIYNTDTSELRDIGNINLTQLSSDVSNSILLNVQKERERFNKLQALNNRQSLIRNVINTTSSILDLPTILRPNQDYWNPAPIRVDVPDDWGYEKTGWISEGMKRTGPRQDVYTPYLKTAARTEFLKGAAQGLPLTFGGSFAAMGIRSVFRGAFSTVQGWINSSMERERAQLQMNLKEEQALNIAVNISSSLEQQFPWLNKDDVYLLEYTTGNKDLIIKDRKKYGNFINEYKSFYEFGGINNAYYSVNVENTDWAQLYNLTTTEAEIFKIIMKQGIFFNPTNLNKFSDTKLPQYVERFDDE